MDHIQEELTNLLFAEEKVNTTLAPPLSPGDLLEMEEFPGDDYNYDDKAMSRRIVEEELGDGPVAVS